ncbi:MAG: hypothetical protein KIT31_01960 [Deltaproteobacteria bacterium]|nr:hypothetical protein [Deltaproteobacteria bacterium]
MSRQEAVRHVLAVAVRVEDHFLGTPVLETLDVRIDGDRRPHAHGDGTYCFIGVEDGVHELTIGGLADRWMALEPTPGLVLPLANPGEAIVVPVWPTPSQPTPLGLTSVRGKLVGGPQQTLGRRVEIDVGATPAVHHTISTSRAEFLFLLPGALALDGEGNVPITIRVGGAAVTGGEVVDGEERTPFAGSSIAIAPGREAHLRVHVT